MSSSLLEVPQTSWISFFSSLSKQPSFLALKDCYEPCKQSTSCIPKGLLLASKVGLNFFKAFWLYPNLCTSLSNIIFQPKLCNKTSFFLCSIIKITDPYWTCTNKNCRENKNTQSPRISKFWRDQIEKKKHSNTAYKKRNWSNCSKSQVE